MISTLPAPVRERPMSKGDVIAEIQKRHRSASTDFLTPFHEAELRAYLASLGRLSPDPRWTRRGGENPPKRVFAFD